MRKKIFFLLLSFYLFLPAAARAEIDSNQQFNDFTSFYYRSPSPNNVPQAMKYFIYSPLFREGREERGEMIEVSAYFFGLASQLDPFLLRKYAEIFETTDEPGKLFILSSFRVWRDKETESFLLAHKEGSPQAVRDKIGEVLSSAPEGNSRRLEGVKNYSDLNFLWMEFFVTGRKEPIERLIDVLSWEDVFRSKVNLWLKKKRGKDDKKRLSELIKNDLKLIIDLDKEDLGFSGDLDCVYGTTVMALYSQDKSRSDYGEAVRKKLGLSAEDKLYMAAKGTVMWALYSNSKQHPKVLQFCREELAARKDKSRNELQMIVNFASPAAPR